MAYESMRASEAAFGSSSSAGVPFGATVSCSVASDASLKPSVTYMRCALQAMNPTQKRTLAAGHYLLNVVRSDIRVLALISAGTRGT